jgi:hypothetical protein
VRYAGADSLLFIAKTDDEESEDAFFARMTRLVGLLHAAGVTTGPIAPGYADFTVVELVGEGEAAAQRYPGVLAAIYWNSERNSRPIMPSRRRPRRGPP